MNQRGWVSDRVLTITSQTFLSYKNTIQSHLRSEFGYSHHLCKAPILSSVLYSQKTGAKFQSPITLFRSLLLKILVFLFMTPKCQPRILQQKGGRVSHLRRLWLCDDVHALRYDQISSVGMLLPEIEKWLEITAPLHCNPTTHPRIIWRGEIILSLQKQEIFLPYHGNQFETPLLESLEILRPETHHFFILTRKINQKRNQKSLISSLRIIITENNSERLSKEAKGSKLLGIHEREGF